MKASYDSKNAIALFGSVARGDYDKFSDKDVLIVDDDVTRAKDLVRMFTQTGWSPVHYSWRRLEATAYSRRLFVQHLRQDAKVLRDDDGRLHSIFGDFRPSTSYHEELQRAETFLYLPLMIPNCLRGLYWTADVLSVGLRNYGILKLAQHGIYHFNFRAVLRGLVRIGTLKASDVVSLDRLRKYKRMYRDRVFAKDLTFEQAEQLVNLVSDRVGLCCAAKRCSAERTLCEALFPIHGEEWYSQARKLEAALISVARSNRGNSERSSFETDVERAVKSPADYGWTIKTNQSWFRSELSALAGSCELARW